MLECVAARPTAVNPDRPEPFTFSSILPSSPRHVLGKATPSGFSQNVDTFTYRPPRPTSGQRLTTMNQAQARQFSSAANTSRVRAFLSKSEGPLCLFVSACV